MGKKDKKSLKGRSKSLPHKEDNTFAGPIVLVACLFLFGVTWLFGGIDGLIINIKGAPDPTSAKLVKAREDTKLKIYAQQEKLKEIAGFTYYDTSSYDTCFRGHADAKSSTDYANICRFSMTYFYGFDTDFASTILELENKIKQAGWSYPHATGISLSSVINEYYDDRAEYARRHGTSYTASNLPTVGNYAGYQNDGSTLSFSFLDLSVPITSKLDDIQKQGQHNDNSYVDDQTIPSSEIIKRAAGKNKYLISFNIREDYFRN